MHWAGVQGEPGEGAGPPSAALDTRDRGRACLCHPGSVLEWDSTGLEQSHEEHPEPQVAPPCPAEEVTGRAALGALKTPSQKHVASHGRFFVVFFLE